MRQICLVLAFIILDASQIVSQDDIRFTNSFDLKLLIHDIDFFDPVERWLKITPMEDDEYLKYDAVFHSPPSIEMRIDIDPDHRRFVPTVEIQRALSSIASNDENLTMEVTKFPRRYAKEKFQADLVVQADFIPKFSFSSFPFGRLIAVYKEGKALIKIIILYEDQLDPYFNRPLSFISSNEEGD